jgi:hypothetical protein
MYGPLFHAVLKGDRIGGALDATDVGCVRKAMSPAAGLSFADAACALAIGPGKTPGRTCCITPDDGRPSRRPGGTRRPLAFSRRSVIIRFGRREPKRTSPMVERRIC